MKKAVCFVCLCVTTVIFAELDTVEMFGRRVYDREDEPVQSEEVRAEVYGIYFSAHWCPPCRAFTPKLVTFYNDVKDAGGNLEVFFVSWDRTEDDMFEYMEEMDMPWLALRHGCSEADALRNQFEVRGIPKLIVLGADGSVITEDGRRDVQSKGIQAWTEWMDAVGKSAAQK